MRNCLIISLLAALGMLAPVAIAGEVPASFQTCIACHGAAGEGNAALNAPALAGQDASYLERQLRAFQSGVRGGDAGDQPGSQMKAMASMLSQNDIPVVSAFLAELPLPVVAPSQEANLKNGNNYYQSKCGACHGGKARGNVGLNSPALSGLNATYLVRQFENFQKGVRGSHPDDTYGRQMKMMSTSLPTEKDLVDVIAFIHSLGASE